MFQGAVTYIEGAGVLLTAFAITIIAQVENMKTLIMLDGQHPLSVDYLAGQTFAAMATIDSEMKSEDIWVLTCSNCLSTTWCRGETSESQISLVKLWAARISTIF